MSFKMEKRFIVLDTETTGLEVEKGHRIIEIGGVVMNGEKDFRNFPCIHQSSKEIDKEAQAVHGISNEDLEDKPFSDIAEDFLEFIDGSTLVIHNADFDVGFLDAELKIASSTYPAISDICEIKDTLAIARNKFPGQRNSLDALSKRFEISGYDRSYHGALLDANILADVYSNLTGGQSKINFAKNFDTNQEEDKKQKRNLSNDFEITKIVTSEDDQILHSKRLEEIEAKIGKKTLWNS